jgi:hypothetical protein
LGIDKPENEQEQAFADYLKTLFQIAKNHCEK